VQFFNLLILNVPPTAAVQWNNVLSQARMGDRENGMLCLCAFKTTSCNWISYGRGVT